MEIESHRQYSRRTKTAEHRRVDKRRSRTVLQIVFHKSFSHVRLAITVCIAQHLYLIGATLYNEDVAIRCGEQESRVAKSTGVQFNFEPRWNLEFRVRWPCHDVRPIDCESIRTRRRQVLHRDLARDARCITCPIAHCSLAGEDRAFFSGGGDYDSNDENGCKKDCARNWIAQSTGSHLKGIVRPPNIARLRFARRESVFHNRAVALVFFKTGTIENA